MEVTPLVPGSVFARRIRLGGVVMILAGITLAPQGPLTFDVPSAPEQNLEFALGANSLRYRLGVMLAGVALSLLVLSVFALYARLSVTNRETLALVGLVMTVGSLVLFLPLAGFAFYVVPAIGELVDRGATEMVEVMDQTFLEPFIVIPFLGGLLWNVGIILLGIAVWRSRAVWKWSGILLLTWGVVGIPAFLDVKPLQIMSTLLGGLALVTVGIGLRRSVTIDTQAEQAATPDA